MRKYNKILFFENKRRIKKLDRFRELVANFYKNCEYDRGLIENEEASRARTEINKEMVEIHDVVMAARLVPVLKWIPPATIGGYSQNIDLILNVFHLWEYEIDEENVFDYVERAIGVYEKNKRSSLLRLFNPFFYLGLIFDLIANSPFALLGRMGFNREKAEASVLGRFIKGFIQLVLFLAAAFTVLYYLGYMDKLKEVIKSLFGKG